MKVEVVDAAAAAAATSAATPPPSSTPSKAAGKATGKAKGKAKGKDKGKGKGKVDPAPFVPVYIHQKVEYRREGTTAELSPDKQALFDFVVEHCNVPRDFENDHKYVR